MSLYPNAPGHRGIDTSIAAAVSITPKAKSLQNRVLEAIREAGEAGRTGDELAVRLELERWSIRPRTSELRCKNLIRDSGQRRLNLSGRMAIVWVAI